MLVFKINKKMTSTFISSVNRRILEFYSNQLRRKLIGGIHAYTHIHTYAHIYRHTYIYTHIHENTHVCTATHTCTYMHIQLHIHTGTCTHTHKFSSFIENMFTNDSKELEIQITLQSQPSGGWSAGGSWAKGASLGYSETWLCHCCSVAAVVLYMYSFPGTNK